MSISLEIEDTDGGENLASPLGSEIPPEIATGAPKVSTATATEDSRRSAGQPQAAAGSVQMQGLPPAHLPMVEEQPVPLTPAPPPTPQGDAEALPLPPSSLELVK